MWVVMVGRKGFGKLFVTFTLAVGEFNWYYFKVDFVSFLT